MLGDFVRLLKYHEKEIRVFMPQPHPINKVRNLRGKNVISTGELCVIFINSSNPLAKRFGYGFGMESATLAQFHKMVQRVKMAGFSQEANELQRRMGRSYIDLQFSSHLLNAGSKRDPGNAWDYRDYSFFQEYQCLRGSARGFEVDWELVNNAVSSLESR